MAVPFDKAGGREFALAGEPAPVFRVMAKELSTPKVLVCLEDKERFRTNDFSGMTERNLSYFIGIDANESNPQTILTGDRNLTLSNAPVSRGLVLITDPKAAGWSRALHNQQGNTGLADGSAMQVNGAGLQRSLQANDRLAVP